MFSDRSKAILGSSPLTRGKPTALLSGLSKGGLIPAHAGKTSNYAHKRHKHWAHPRSRGENLHDVDEPGGYPGSSPLTRGKPPTARASLSRSGAHPRSRGENVVRPGATILEPGSSPLTRGKPHRRDDQPRRRVAHPRSRGENDEK